ncbi:hypothetical protein RHMOL_Rhmol09G0114500 [Rhododendron molle]|uniref:Uncharacterized protein n=1 Tax=Rhododendron molle TaxID=49168 RepID=A0ACC0MCF1_RHOML|nr:hypothetical protein RHMOL_Rhmol09G0114500 [Rhododendron molle]
MKRGKQQMSTGVDKILDLWAVAIICRCKKYPSMELRGLFQYRVNQLKKGNGIELVLLQALIKSTNRLRDSLLPKEDKKIAIPLLLLIAQHRSVLHHLGCPKFLRKFLELTLLITRSCGNESMHLPKFEVVINADAPYIKMVSEEFDRCHGTLLQFVDFLCSAVMPATTYAQLIPPLNDLVHLHHLNPEVAFLIYRPVMRLFKCQSSSDVFWPLANIEAPKDSESSGSIASSQPYSRFILLVPSAKAALCFPNSPEVCYQGRSRSNIHLKIQNPNTVQVSKYITNLFGPCLPLEVQWQWSQRITKLLIQCLESTKYMEMQNSLILLTKIAGVFPVTQKSGINLEKRVAKIKSDQREDLKVLATGVAAALAARKPSWVTEEEFSMGYLKPAPTLASKSLAHNLVSVQSEPAGGRVVDAGLGKTSSGRLEGTESASLKSDSGRAKLKPVPLVNGSDGQASMPSASVQAGTFKPIEGQK